MQIFLDENLVFLAVPKAGSTAYETALRPRASIDVKGPPGDRHMTARRFRRTWAPFLKRVWNAAPETMAVLRHPRARLESWYRYRRQDARDKSTAAMSFDDFVRAVLSDAPPDAARIGSQAAFVSDRRGKVMVDHLFALEAPDPLAVFLEARFGSAFAVRRANVSPAADVSLSAETEALLARSRAAEFALYDRVRSAGHLRLQPVPPA